MVWFAAGSLWLGVFGLRVFVVGLRVGLLFGLWGWLIVGCNVELRLCLGLAVVVGMVCFGCLL